MKNKLLLVCFLSTFLLPPTPVQSAGDPVFDVGLMAELVALQAIADYLMGAFEDTVVEFENGYTDEVAELKITDATAKSEIQGQTAAISASFKQQTIANAVTANTDIWSPLSQSDFACTSECMGRNIIQGHNGPRDVANSTNTAVMAINQGFSSHNQTFQVLPNASNLTDARILLPSGKTNGNSSRVTQYIGILSNPIPAANLSTYGQATAGRNRYETLRGLKNISLSVVQRVLSNQAGDIFPAYPIGNDPWFSQMEQALGGSVTDLDIENQAVSGGGTLAMQVKSRFENPNWHLDIHRKTTTGGLRTLVAMNAVQLELKRQIYKANQDILLLQSLYNGIEATTFYKEPIERFSGKAVTQ